MPDRHPFYDSAKHEALEEAAMIIINGLFASADERNYCGSDITENGNKLQVDLHYVVEHETQVIVRCDLEYHGQCASLKQMTFISR